MTWYRMLFHCHRNQINKNRDPNHCLSFCLFSFGHLYCLSFFHLFLLNSYLVSTNLSMIRLFLRIYICSLFLTAGNLVIKRSRKKFKTLDIKFYFSVSLNWLLRELYITFQMFINFWIVIWYPQIFLWLGCFWGYIYLHASINRQVSARPHSTQHTCLPLWPFPEIFLFIDKM
jgi:hypothetical protein